MQDNAKMKKIPPYRDYDGLYQEIHQNSTNAQQLVKIAIALLTDNKRLSQEAKKQYSALDQIHLLVHKLYIVLTNKISEVKFLNVCLRLAQQSQAAAFHKNNKPLCNSKDCLSKVENAIQSMISNLQMLKFLAQVLCDDYDSIFWLPLAKSVSQTGLCVSNLLQCFKEISSKWKLKSFKEDDSESESTEGPVRTGRKRGKKSIVKNDKAKRRKQEKIGVTMNNFSKCSNRRNKSNQKEKCKDDNSARRMENVASTTENVLYFNNLKISKDDWKYFKHSSSRWLSVNLIDVLNNPAAECDADVQQYKQANLCKDKDNVYKAVDVDAPGNQEKLSNSTEKCDMMNSEKNVQHESHNISFNDDEDCNSDLNTDSQDEDDKQEATVVISDADEDEEQGILNEKATMEDKETPGSSKLDCSTHDSRQEGVTFSEENDSDSETFHSEFTSDEDSPAY